MKADDLEELIFKLIPPQTFEAREGFSSEEILGTLDSKQQVEVGYRLVSMLNGVFDELVVSSLVYLQFTDAVEGLHALLNRVTFPLERMIVAAAIYSLSHDRTMATVAVDAFNSIDNVYSQAYAFSYLKVFNMEETNAIIKRYVNSDTLVLLCNSRRALGYTQNGRKWIRPSL